MTALDEAGADQRLASYVDRILALKAREDDLNLEVRAVYAKLKDLGYDKTAVGKLVAYLRLPPDDRCELSADSELCLLMSLRQWPADLGSNSSLADLLVKGRA